MGLVSSFGMRLGWGDVPVKVIFLNLLAIAIDKNAIVAENMQKWWCYPSESCPCKIWAWIRGEFLLHYMQFAV